MSKTSPSSLKARLEQLERELAAQSRSMNTAATLSAIIGVVVLAVLGGYFAFGYTMIEEATRPTRLIDGAQTVISENLPNARKSVEAEITKSAPTWAENLSKQAVSGLPTAREKLVDYAKEQMNSGVNEASLVTEAEFRAFLQKNRAELDKKFDELGKDPKLADASLVELETLVETQFKTNMTTQASEFLGTLKTLVERLKKLSAGTGLTAEEQRQRHLLMMARRIEEQTVGETGVSMPEPPAADSSRRKEAAAKIAPKTGGAKKEAPAAKSDEKDAPPPAATEEKKDTPKS